MNLDERIEGLIEGWKAGDDVGQVKDRAKQIIRDVLEFVTDVPTLFLSDETNTTWFRSANKAAMEAKIKELGL